MIQFGILDYPVFLPGLLLVDTFVTAVSYVVTSMAKTSS
jgi:hypothetical protein